MAKPQYDYAHKQARINAIRNLVDGTRCPRCRRGMFRRQKLDLDHVIPVVMGGSGGPTRLMHAYCNRSAGAALRRVVRRGVRSGGTPRRVLPRW